MISYDEFKKVEVRAGKILSAEKIPDTDKLLKLSVDFGEKKVVPPAEEGGVATEEPSYRQIVSGIAMHFPDPSVLVGTTCMFVTNLEPRTIRGLESQGMIFAVSSPEGGFSLLKPNETIPPGALAA